MGDFLLFSVWVSSYKVSWNKLDASDLGADLSIVKAAVSKVSKALQLAYAWAGKFWITYFTKAYYHSFSWSAIYSKGELVLFVTPQAVLQGIIDVFWNLYCS